MSGDNSPFGFATVGNGLGYVLRHTLRSCRRGIVGNSAVGKNVLFYLSNLFQSIQRNDTKTELNRCLIGKLQNCSI